MFLTTFSPTRDPGLDVFNLSNRISRLLNDTLGSVDSRYRDNATAAWVPQVDIFEEADCIRIMAEVPGVRPDDVKVSLEGHVLTIHGTKQQVAEERTERVHATSGPTARSSGLSPCRPPWTPTRSPRITSPACSP